MEPEGTWYRTTHCKECGMLFLAKPDSLRQHCDMCGKKKVLQHRMQLSTLSNANTLKGVLE